MSDLEELRERLRNHRPVPWGQLPDFALYMDQILSYMDRQVIRFRDDDTLTAAMVNNYTKSGLVPRAEGKKYGREHLAYLTAICILKRVMSTRDMDLLIRQELRGRRSVEDGYAAFCDSLDKALRITLREVEQREGLPPGQGASSDGTAASADGTAASADSVPAGNAAIPSGGGTAQSVADNAIHFALLSYAAGVASRRYVAVLRQQTGRAGGPPPSGRAAKREARASEKTARRETKASEKAARRDARGDEKPVRQDAAAPGPDPERDSRYLETNKQGDE